MESNFTKPPYSWYHGLVFLILVNFLSLGWVFMDVKFFQSLNKPYWTPSNRVFGPVWIINNIFVIYGNILALNFWYQYCNKNNKKQKNLELIQSKKEATSENNQKWQNTPDNIVTNQEDSSNHNQLESRETLPNQNFSLFKFGLRRNLKFYFRLQIFSWLNYVLFTQLSFGTRIPAMFFWPTLSMLILTICSLYFAFQIDNQTGSQKFWQTVKAGKSITFSLSTLTLWLIIATFLGFYIWQNN